MENQKSITLKVPTLDNIAGRRTYIPSLFGIVLLLFFFNFCELSCKGQKLASVSGISLATGTTIESPKVDNPFGFEDPSKQDSKEIHSNIWAILALLAAVGGLVFFLIKHKYEDRIGIIAGVSGVISLLLLHITLTSSIKQQGNGMLEVNFLLPYWAALLSFGAAGGISFLRSKQNRATPPIPNPSTPAMSPTHWTEQPPNPSVESFTQPSSQEIALSVLPPPTVPEPVTPPETPSYSSDLPEQPKQTPQQAPVYQSFADKVRVVQAETNAQPRVSQNLMLSLIIGTVALIIIATIVMEFGSGGRTPVTQKTTPKQDAPTRSISGTETHSSTTKANTSTPQPDNAMSIGYIHTLKGSDLRMRSDPSESSEIITNIPNGSPVIILGYDDNYSTVNGETDKWCKINFNGQVGWGWGKFIAKNQEK